jgi:riboflavin kinase/FMN adenylyltransferase
MQLIRDLAAVDVAKPTVLTIGTFDGVHQGHQHLVNQLKVAAQKRQAQTTVIAFHPRPKTVLAPHLAKNDYLTTADERIDLFEQLGLDILVLIPFTRELSQITARDFIKEVVDRLNVAELHVGHDFALGKNREGNVEKLAELGREFGYILQISEPLLLEGRVVSSTQIREYLTAGDVRQAAQLLGRYPSLRGKIVTGAHRGRAIGFPTANFEVPAERLLPANGVYATFVRRQGQNRRDASVTNVGVRPSFGETKPTVETFIFDFEEDIYGQTFTVEFVERLRPEKKFDGIEALIAQIKYDAEQARALLANERSSPA